MPKVGGRKFPYTPKGEAAAKAYASKTGQKMTRRAGGTTAPGKPATPGKAFGQSMKGVGRMGKGKGAK